MTWIEPLEMETWFMAVFSGTPEIFLAVALIAIAGMAGLFRMKLLTMFFMIGVFLLMFSGFISSPIVILIAVVSALLIGYQVSRIFQ